MKKPTRLLAAVAVMATLSMPAIAGAGRGDQPVSLRDQKIASAKSLVAASPEALHGGALQAYSAVDVVIDVDGTSHVRFDRTYRGLPVLGGDFIVHQDGAGALRDVSQTLGSDLVLSTTPAVTHAKAVAAAGSAGRASASQLVIDATGAAPYLAWKVVTRGVHPDGTPSELHSLVDAQTGVLVRQEERVHAAEGDGVGVVSGEVPLTTEGTGPYNLKDPQRGYTYVGDAQNKTDFCILILCLIRAPAVLFNDADNHWGNGTLANRQSVAVDAHYGAAMTWDYYKNTHTRNGIAGDGRGSYSRVHYGNNYANAFWMDSCFCMTYGDGDGVTYNPLVSLDVVAHEMSHGVMSKTARLVYSGESGGLNEANSDIFGTLVEFYAENEVDPPDYLIGEEIRKDGRPLRWMDKPSRDGRSVDCWSSGVGNLDVHLSSGVGNHFFYLLAVGSGESEFGDSPTCNGAPAVEGIGNDAAGDIWYRAITVYMTSSTNFAGARVATMNAARDLFGAGSEEQDAVAAAWKAVNVN